jgi:hypothetical protein
MIDRSAKDGSPKHVAFMESINRVPGTTPDMIVRNLPAVPPKLLANEPWRLDAVRVAPLK